MNLLVSISEMIDRLLDRIAKIAGWAGVVLIVITVFDVITRRFFVLGSTKLQEAEWHAHVVLFALLIGATYLRNSHVRIDLVRDQLSQRVQWWIELLGTILFLLPYCALVVYFSFDYAVRSYEIGEVSASATGLSHRWIIKSMIPIGFGLLGLAGIAVLFRKIALLFGSPDLRARILKEEAAEDSAPETAEGQG